MRYAFKAIALATILAGSAHAAPRNVPTKTQPAGTAVLLQGLKAAVAPVASPSAQADPAVDRDQGDEHASDRAILTVCSKSTPAARRSAICNGQVISPD